MARKQNYRQRYKVERSFAWLDAFRRRLIRWERLFSVYRSGFPFAVMLLWYAPSDCPRVSDPVGLRRAVGVCGGVRGTSGTSGTTTLEHEPLKQLMDEPAD